MKKPVRVLVGSLIFLFFVYAAGRAGDQYAQASARGPVAVNPPSVAFPVSSAVSAHEQAPLAVDSLSSRQAIRQVFGGNVRALRVARCESKLNQRAVSSTGDYGLYQLHRSIWDPALNPRARPYWPRGTDWSDVFDPVVNARVAWAISKRGTDFWTHWRWSAGCWA